MPVVCALRIIHDLVVVELFDVEYYCDLEMWVRGLWYHSKAWVRAGNGSNGSQFWMGHGSQYDDPRPITLICCVAYFAWLI